MKGNQFNLIGCASGIAGADIHSGDGPVKIKQSKLSSSLTASGIPFVWREMVTAGNPDSGRKQTLIAESCTSLAKIISPLVKNAEPFCVIGGDHSCAIGTWSGVYDAMHDQGDLGLIWIDAHMDAHTPETTPSGNIHGMPLACLLGYGFPELTSVLHPAAKFKPENVCLVGVRSFEQGEAALLERLNVRVYYMDEVKQRGLADVMQEAVLARVTAKTVGFGMTIDIDAVDPQDAPGVDVPEDNGIRGADLCDVIQTIAADPRLIATEVVEFDPSHDSADKTEKLIANLIKVIAAGALRGKYV